MDQPAFAANTADRHIFDVSGGGFLRPVRQRCSWVFLIVTAGFIAGALGVSNERRSGYYAAVATSVLNVAITTWLLLTSGFGVIFALAVSIAILALLLNRQSRHYQRIWFR